MMALHSALEGFFVLRCGIRVPSKRKRSCCVIASSLMKTLLLQQIQAVLQCTNTRTHTDSHTHAHSTSCAGPPGSSPRMLPPVGPPCSLPPSSDRARQWSTGHTRRTAASLLSHPAPTSSWFHATVQCSTQKSEAGRQDQLRWEKVVETVNRVRSWKVCMQLDCKHGNDATHHPLVGSDSHCHQLLHQRWDHGKGLRKASPAITEKHKALDM